MSIQVSDRSVSRIIKDLSAEFYVRKQLDTEWAIQLGELIESGVELDPIFITRDGKVIDGRHRIEAHELAGKTEIRCKIVDADNDIELVVFAMKCNMGGSLPPNKADIEHTICELLNRGVPKKKIEEVFDILPGRLVRKYLGEVESRLLRAKLAKAATAVVEGGLTLAKSAEQYQVKEGDLRAMLGSKAKRKKNGVGELRRELTSRFRSSGAKTAFALRKMIELYQDGDVSHRQVLDLFDHLDSLTRQEARAIAGWRKRFDAAEAPKKIA